MHESTDTQPPGVGCARRICQPLDLWVVCERGLPYVPHLQWVVSVHEWCRQVGRRPPASLQLGLLIIALFQFPGAALWDQLCPSALNRWAVAQKAHCFLASWCPACLITPKRPGLGLIQWLGSPRYETGALGTWGRAETTKDDASWKLLFLLEGAGKRQKLQWCNWSQLGAAGII